MVTEDQIQGAFESDDPVNALIGLGTNVDVANMAVNFYFAGVDPDHRSRFIGSVKNLVNRGTSAVDKAEFQLRLGNEIRDE